MPFAKADYAPPHTQTQSTLAPTSEYVRYLLLALPARYVLRGIFGLAFNTSPYTENMFGRALGRVGEWSQKLFKITGDAETRTKAAHHKWAFWYNATMGVGSLALTTSYSWTVYQDIKNIFSEAVALESGRKPEEIGYAELKKSDNRIVQKTMENYFWRTFKRAFTDLFFFPMAAARSERGGDLMIGLKALQALTETWKRKTTMFEDLVTFINNKINPRNGLGQAINVGEVFDLYQHYCESYAPEKMFQNVVERGTGEGARWARAQPIFERMAQLMNLTYAYKHSSVIDPATGHAIHQANFSLPKLIYLLGHDLIDVGTPDETLARIDIANHYGIPAVKEMQAMLQQGSAAERTTALARVLEKFPIPAREESSKPAKENGKNGVIAKGSTMQLDQSPVSKIDAASVNSLAPAFSHTPAVSL